MAGQPDPIAAEVVRRMFQQHWPRAGNYPDNFWCGHIACALRVLRDRRPPPEPDIPEAIRYGGLFDRHAPALIVELEREASAYVIFDANTNEPQFIDQERYRRCRAAIEALNLAQAAVEAAVSVWNDRNPLRLTDRDPAKFLCEMVQLAWEGTAGADVPRSINEDDPLCKFIAQGLTHAGIRPGQGKHKGGEYTPSAVSSVLRGRTKSLNFIRTGRG